MKFYYQDRLIRTSQSHHYKYAVINTDNGHLEGCRTGISEAQAIINTAIHWREESIANAQAALKALADGKNGFYTKDGRRTWYCRLDPKFHTEEKLNRNIENDKQSIEYIKQNWHIVELEER